jgi:hypothetical protein
MQQPLTPVHALIRAPPHPSRMPIVMSWKGLSSGISEKVVFIPPSCCTIDKLSLLGPISPQNKQHIATREMTMQQPLTPVHAPI